jgi:tRNA-dihydrouridine synthase B
MVHEIFSSGTEKVPARTLVGLAPMAGYSDAPFRRLCAAFGADFAVTEMVSADGLVRDGERTRFLLRTLDGEAPLGVQLFGADPATMARAATMVAAGGYAWIDLNFGCPVRKVIRKNGGAAMMRNLGRMAAIAEAVVRAVDIPVTAKIRSGWSKQEENYVAAGRACEESGVSAVILHPRYRTQGFSGGAHWEHIAELAHHLSIPVIANGDVWTVGDFESIVRVTGCRLVMVGRGALGRPWLFKQIKDRIAGGTPSDVPFTDRVDTIERLVRLETSWRGERSGILELRKHYRWFLKGVPGLRGYRAALSRAGTRGEVFLILDAMRKEPVSTWKRSA